MTKASDDGLQRHWVVPSGKAMVQYMLTEAAKVICSMFWSVLYTLLSVSVFWKKKYLSVRKH